MLVLTRKLDESIRIGDDIKITILRIKGNTIRLGIEAPRDVRVVRSELNATLAAEPTAVETVAQEQSAIVTAIVDSPNASSPRLFVGKVTADGSQVNLDETDPGTNASALANAGIVRFDAPGASVASAPLRAFLQASRGLTAV